MVELKEENTALKKELFWIYINILYKIGEFDETNIRKRIRNLKYEIGLGGTDIIKE